MRHPATLTALAFSLLLPVQALAAVTVPIDQSRRLGFSGQAANVVVGNPAIADVSVVDGRTLMVLGKKLGITNLVVFDPAGRTLYDSEIIVSGGGDATVSVYRGVDEASYACSPYCQSTSAAPNPFSSLMSAMAGAAGAQPGAAPAPRASMAVQ